MEEGPRGYNICPSCGTEFGLHDVNSTIEDLRTAWLESGAKWHSAVVPEPEKWNQAQQLATLLFSRADIQVSEYDVGVIVPVAAGSDQAKFAYRLSELQYA